MIHSDGGWANIYPEFGALDCWPRGFPLQCILNNHREISNADCNKSWSVMQYLADEDPDVDAIYRMTHASSVYFARNKKFTLSEGTFSPFNSQATLWLPEAFPLMFLPIGKTDRVTDILRGYIALASLWKGGSTLGISSPIVYQRRNVHNLFKDYEQEHDLYKHCNEWSQKFTNVKGGSFADVFRGIINLLVDDGHLPSLNIEAYKFFLSEINKYK